MVLSRVVELAQPQPHWLALDIGTGTGHTAFAIAPGVRWVFGLDLTPEMLAVARKEQRLNGVLNVTFEVGDAQQLPYDDKRFDLVTCRRTAHHFTSITQALLEMKRVLVPGGRLVIDDRSVPEDDFIDGLMHELDRWHDHSHVRQYRPSRWLRFLEQAGFAVYAVEPYVQHRPLTAFTEGVGAEDVARINARLDGLDADERRAIDLRVVDGQPHLNHWYVMLCANKL